MFYAVSAIFPPENGGDENENRVKTTVANQFTWVRNHVFTFLSLVNRDLPVKNIVFIKNIHYL